MWPRLAALLSFPIVCALHRSTELHNNNGNSKRVLSLEKTAAPFKERHFPLLLSGICPDLPLDWMATKGECESGARILGLNFSSVQALVSLKHPRGCTYAPASNTLSFNAHALSAQSCGINGFGCLCAPFVGPPCDIQDGSAPHASSLGGCLCGSKAVCVGANSTGLFCRGDLDRCRNIPYQHVSPTEV